MADIVMGVMVGMSRVLDRAQEDTEEEKEVKIREDAAGRNLLEETKKDIWTPSLGAT